jgi:hypothetical protein
LELGFAAARVRSYFAGAAGTLGGLPFEDRREQAVCMRGSIGVVVERLGDGEEAEGGDRVAERVEGLAGAR